jgi:hypothetical protein
MRNLALRLFRVRKIQLDFNCSFNAKISNSYELLFGFLQNCETNSVYLAHYFAQATLACNY